MNDTHGELTRRFLHSVVVVVVHANQFLMVHLYKHMLALL